MKKIIKILGIIVLIFVIIVVGLFVWMTSDQKSKMNKLNFNDIDMNMVEDGTYIGTASTGMVNVKVSVTVSDNKITNIELIKHENGLGGKAEGIIDEMVKSNTYEVDSVSGATTSSQTIKSAVCNALSKGIVND